MCSSQILLKSLKIKSHNNHCCTSLEARRKCARHKIIAAVQGGQGKMQALIFLQKRQWDIENKAHHRLKESKMGRKGLEEDFKAQNNQRRQV
jgi:hypothetical protein